MPVIDIHHPRMHAPEGFLSSLCRDVTLLLGIPPEHAFAVWHPVSLGNAWRPGWSEDASGADVGPIVRIRCKASYTEEQTEALMTLVSDRLALALGCAKESNFILLDRVQPGQLMARGEIWKPTSDSTSAITVRPIGFVRNDRKELTDDFWGDVVSDIEIDSSVVPSHSLEGLEKFSHAEVIFHFDRVAGKALNLDLRSPRGLAHLPRVGVFSQRVKDRPNWLGISRCEVLVRNGSTLTVRGLDAVDGTPVLDIKPWMDAFGPRQTTIEPPWVAQIMSDYYSVACVSAPPQDAPAPLRLWSRIARTLRLRWPAYSKEEAEIVLRSLQL